MEISHPRRILAVSQPDSGLLDLVKSSIPLSQNTPRFLTPDADLTGIEATLTADTVAGTTHNWPIKTAYYTANIPIWLDEITEPQTWSA